MGGTGELVNEEMKANNQTDQPKLSTKVPLFLGGKIALQPVGYAVRMFAAKMLRAQMLQRESQNQHILPLCALTLLEDHPRHLEAKGPCKDTDGSQKGSFRVQAQGRW